MVVLNWENVEGGIDTYVLADLTEGYTSANHRVAFVEPVSMHMRLDTFSFQVQTFLMTHPRPS